MADYPETRNRETTHSGGRPGEHPSFYCTSSIVLRGCVFLQIGGKTLHHQKDYCSLYGDGPFMAVVWD